MKNITVLRRHFQQHFEIQSRKVPSYMAFKRLVERFIATQGMLHPPVPVGRHPLSEKSVALVKGFGKILGSLKRTLRDLDRVVE